ncbi:Vacuolar protein sorting-associated protein [Paramyrothecium foliicola]|nr:Vacuolar protein sorting-associated protein [Paramyrothecium foliicola]
MYWVRRATIFSCIIFSFCFCAWFLPRFLDPTKPNPEKRLRDLRWVNSSPYFFDRQLCRWLSLCGLHHLRGDPAALPFVGNKTEEELRWEEWLDSRQLSRRSWDDAPPLRKPDTKRNVHERRRVIKDVPDYVLKYAPLVHLYSEEQFWPSDIREHLQHMTPFIETEEVNATDPWTLHNLDKLNDEAGFVVLHSNDDVESRPDWLHSHYNVPNAFPDDPERGDDKWSRERPKGRGRLTEPTTWYDVDKKHPLHRIADPRQLRFQSQRRSETPDPSTTFGHKPNDDGYSKAPAILVLVDKGSGVLDAFWFFFYSYNLGQTVLGIRFGNHVGDWEHCMMRFENGVPRGIFFSEHEGGQAYTYEAVEKSGVRPVIYSAVGSHAMYALPGTHPYILPFRLLKDETDKGPLWDPALNNYAYHYDYTLETPKEDDELGADGPDSHHPESLVAAASNPNAPTSWFHFGGRWGDRLYSLADMRQWRFFGQYHYVNGPRGPKFKRLGRSKICQTERCTLMHELDPKGKWY